MLRFILRILLVIVFVRFVGGLLRALAGGAESQRLKEATPKPPSKPLVDRSRAIDVPFTEERRET